MSFTNSIQRSGQVAANMSRAVRMVWSGAAGWTVLSICLSFVQAGLPIAGLFLLKAIINTAVAAGKNPLAPEHLHRLLLLIGGAMLIQLLSALAGSVAQVVSEAQAEQVTEHMEDLLHRKAVELSTNLTTGCGCAGTPPPPLRAPLPAMR